MIGGESDKHPYILDVQQLENGVMLASKNLIVRRDDSQSLCRVQGGGHGGRRDPHPMSRHRIARETRAGNVFVKLLSR